MEYDVRGTVMQTVDCWLQAGESVYTESGGMCWMTPNIDMSTGAKGGFLKSLGRKLSGESFFMTTYSCTQGKGMVSFASEFVGKILPVELGEGEERIVQKDAFMAAETGVELSMHFRKKLGVGFFGGEGFILQKLTGPGTAFVEISGEITEYNLDAGQTLKIDQSYLAMMEPSVDFDITRVKGVSNVLFSGEGLFLATVRGPGKVWLQSMPLTTIIAKIAARISTNSS
jgi:uncharacterized protein (TIGR00266 family)